MRGSVELQGHPRLFEDFTPQHLSITAWAYATLSFRHLGLMDLLAKEADGSSSQIRGGKPAHGKEILYLGVHFLFHVVVGFLFRVRHADVWKPLKGAKFGLP